MSTHPARFPRAPRVAACVLLASSAALRAQCEVVKLTAQVPQHSAEFGAAVALDGAHLAIGAPGEDGPGFQGGAVHVFRRDAHGTPQDPSDDTWTEEALLHVAPAVNYAGFGSAVALHGGRLLVGAPHDGTGSQLHGAAYVFRHDDGGTPDDPGDDTWPQEARLEPTDVPNGTFGISFGESAALDGEHLIVGASMDDEQGNQSGSAYIFRRDDGGTPADPADDTWLLQGKLFASNGKAFAYFGACVALSGDHALVGARGAKFVAGLDSGAAYMFVRKDHGTPDPTDDVWEQQTILKAYDAAVGAQFGWSVALDGDDALVGARTDSYAGPGAGAVYAYFRTDGGTPDNPGDDQWLPTPKVVALDAEPLDWFGMAVALHGHDALIRSKHHAPGAPLDAAAYLVRRDDGGTPLDPGDDHWEHLAEINVPLGIAAFDGVALDGDEALIGVSDDESVVSGGGAAHLLAVEQQPWLWIEQQLPGSEGQPCLFATGALGPGSRFRLALHHALPNATTILVVGASALDLPVKGGLLVPAPDRLFVAPADADGAFVWQGQWPAAYPTGVSFFFQAWIADPAGPAGFAATNAVSALSR